MIAIVRRRARRDALLLVVWASLICFALVLATAVPRLLVDTVDGGAREAVRSAGARADLILHLTVGKSTPSQLRVSPEHVIDLQESIVRRLPPALRKTYKDSVVTAVSAAAGVITVNGKLPATPLNAAVAMLTPGESASLTVRSGRLPSATSKNEIVVSSATARLASLRVGSNLSLPPPDSGGPAAVGPSVTVVGIVDKATAGASTSSRSWADLGQFWSPARIHGATEITVLATPTALRHVADVFSDGYRGTIRLRLDPQAFTADREAAVAREVTALSANDDALVAGTGVIVVLDSEFAEALAGFPFEARAAVAQMSLMIAGMLGVAIAVLILLSQLLVSRRTTELALERARGSSLAAIGLRAGIESLLTSAVGAAVALAIAWLFVRDPDLSLSAAVVVFAVGAPVVQSVALGGSSWRGIRELADRRDRFEAVKRSRSRRLVLEGGLVVLALGALIAARTRGLLETRTDGVDPLISAAPLLLAIVVTLVVLRVAPGVVAVATALGRRSQGPLGLLAAMQMRRALRVLPAFALTLAVSIAVGSGLLVDTVRAGQVDASWQRIGADVRVDGTIANDDAGAAKEAPGVFGSTTLRVVPHASVTAGPSSATVTVLAIPSTYPKLVRQLPEDAGGGAVAAAMLSRLSTASSTIGRLPVVVDRELNRQLVTRDLRVRYAGHTVAVSVIGVVDTGPRGYLDGPFLFVDLAAVSERAQTPAVANEFLAVGPGAAAAAKSVASKNATTQTRGGWIDDRRHRSLIAGVNSMALLATIAVALLAIFALVATVVATARTRSLSLALLRTLGMRSRLGWWLAFSELAPVVIAALIGGTLGAIVTEQILAPVFGLGLLAGGVDEPIPSTSPVVIVSVAAGALVLLGLAILTEFVMHRRDRVSKFLREGASE